MNSILRSIFAAAMLVGAHSAFATMDCWISVPSDLNNPMTWDKTLWEDKFDSTDFHMIVVKDLSKAMLVTEDQSMDKEFLKQYEGDYAVAVAKPYPNDETPGDVLLSLSTIDTSLPFNRSNWTNSVGKIDQSNGPGYGLFISDFSRHVSIDCR